MSAITDSIIQVHAPYDQNILYQLHVEHNNFEPEKSTLVFLHGYLGSSDDYNFFKQNYHDNYNIISMDLRGHGESASPYDINWNIDDFTYDCYQVISSIVPTGHKVTIMASSLATAIALQFASDYPDMVETLFLISPSNKFSKSAFTKIMLGIGKRTPNFILESVVDIFSFVYPFFVIGEEKKKFAKNGIERIKRMDINTHKKIFYETTQNVEIDVSSISCETIIIAGNKDQIVPYSDSLELNRQLKLSTLVTIDNIGHLILHAKTEFIASLLDIWMSKRYKLLRYKNHTQKIINEI